MFAAMVANVERNRLAEAAEDATLEQEPDDGCGLQVREDGPGGAGTPGSYTDGRG
jgi:hypothetical protein